MNKLILNIFFFLVISSFCKAETRYLNVKNFGAVGNGKVNDQLAIQNCIDESVKRNMSCYFPSGIYKIIGDIYLSSNTNIHGEGEKSILLFIEGKVVSEKNNRRDFYFTDNYINEIIPGQHPKTYLTKKTGKGSTSLNLSSTTGFNINDVIYTFNNVNPTWTLFEDQSKVSLFNDSNTVVARSEILKIISIKYNFVILDIKLDFSL